jgi:hypothetical protein
LASFEEAARIGESTLAKAPSDVYVAAERAGSYRGKAESALRSRGPAYREAHEAENTLSKLQ